MVCTAITLPDYYRRQLPVAPVYCTPQPQSTRCPYFIQYVTTHSHAEVTGQTTHKRGFNQGEAKIKQIYFGPQLGRITASPELFNTTGDTNYSEYCYIRFHVDNEITASSKLTIKNTSLTHLLHGSESFLRS